MGRVVLEIEVADADTDDVDVDNEVALARGGEGTEPEDDELAENEMALAAGSDEAAPEDDRAEDDVEGAYADGADDGTDGSVEDGEAEDGAEDELELPETIGVDALFFCAFLSFFFSVLSFSYWLCFAFNDLSPRMKLSSIVKGERRRFFFCKTE